MGIHTVKNCLDRLYQNSDIKIRGKKNKNNSARYQEKIKERHIEYKLP